MEIYNVSKDNFDKEIKNFSGTVLIDFYSPQCAPCRTMNPVIESVARSAGKNVKVCKVNVESETALAEQFGIMSIPTIIVMINGKVMNRSVGVTGKKAVIDMLNNGEFQS